MALAETAKLIASLTLDTKGFVTGATKATASLGKLDARLGKMGGIAKQGLGTAAANITKIGLVAGGFLATQVGLGIRSLEDLERVTNQTAAVIKSTGGAAGITAEQVRNLAQAGEELTTVDDKTIQSGENLLLTFTGISKDIFPRATKAMTDMAVAMAQGDVANVDLKASAIQLGKALNDPVKGMTALTRVGVSFTDAQIEEIKALDKAGKKQQAQEIILRELETEFGKAGEAAGTGFGADMRRFQDAVEEAQQALATGFLPVLQKLASWLKTKLAEPGTLKAIKGLGEGLADALDKALSAASKIPWGSIGDAMRLAGQGAKAALDLFTGMPAWVQTAVLTGWGLNKITGGAVGSIIGELGKGLVKGVLGVNAGVVNAKAGVVNVAGGVGLPGDARLPGRPAGGAAATIGKFILVGVAAAAAVELAGALGRQSDEIKQQGAELVSQAKNWVTAQTTSRQDIVNAINGIDEQLNDPLKRAALEITNPLNQGLSHLEETRAALVSQLDALNAGQGGMTTTMAQGLAGVKTATDAAKTRVQGLTTTMAIGMANQKAAADRTTAAAAVAGRVTATAAAVTTAVLRAKDFSPTVRVTVPVTTLITVRAVTQQTVYSSRYTSTVTRT